MANAGMPAKYAGIINQPVMDVRLKMQKILVSTIVYYSIVLLRKMFNHVSVALIIHANCPEAYQNHIVRFTV